MRKGISHSGAGRYGKIYLRTMSLFESGDSTGDIYLKELCNNRLKPKLTGEVDLRRLAGLIIKGGWPGNLAYSPKDSSEAIKEYINLIIDDDLETFGFLFEAMVERDLKIYADSFNDKCYRYQDYQNREIDTVIELEDGQWCAFEIKLGANKIEEVAKNLLALKQQIEKEKGKAPSVICVICGLSNAAYQRPDGVYVVPITALKP
jgi:predicted AAA+ superfamily ATPase